MSISQYSQNRSKASATPQTMPIPGTAKNNAGGFAFPLGLWKSLDRFIVLGSEGGTYYVSEQKLTADNAKVVTAAFTEDPARTAGRIAEISSAGLAPKNDAAIFALSIGVAMGGKARAYSLAVLPAVCRIGTHLFHFMEFIRRADVGMGRSVQRAIQDWYLKKTPRGLANQLIKYQSRDGWSHADVLRLARPTPREALDSALFAFAAKGEEGWLKKGEGLGRGEKDLAPMMDDFLRLRHVTDAKEAIALIEKWGFPRECVPTELLTKAPIWEALLKDMGRTAMIRNLGNMSKCGLLVAHSDAAKTICERLRDEKEMKRARIHPMQVLFALRTYGSGTGFRGHGTWKPVPSVMEALDEAFYLTFQNVRPTEKRIYFGLDVSGSMSISLANSMLTCREGSAAMAMVTARTEADYECAAFSDKMVPFTISKRDSLDAVVDRTAGLPWAGTDCSLPMLDAMKRKIKVDAFVIYTDSETWAGQMHPVQALKKYREAFGIPSKLIVVGMVSNGFSIADPADAGTLDVVGFDASAPAVLSDFIADREPEKKAQHEG